MGKTRSNSVSARPLSDNKPDRWGFIAGTSALLSAFPHASTGQKAAVAAMAFGAAMFIGLGLIGSVALPAWAVVSTFALATVMIFLTAGLMLAIEKNVAVPFRCRHVPVYPLDDDCREAVSPALEEVRKDAVDLICAAITDVADHDIRANIFLLAPIVGGQADGKWKLVIHPDFAIHMDHPPELQLQLSIGQGATGVAYRDGTYQLTRRLAGPPKKGQWDRKFQMTPELESQIHKRLKWIVSFPLLKPNTREAVGVLNIDGLADVPDDDLLHAVASSIRNKVEVIASHLALHGSLCIGIDQLGVMEHV